MIRFTVPGDPKAWKRSQHNGKRHYTDPIMAGYQNTVRWIAKSSGARILEGPVAVEITAYFRIPESATKARKAAMQAGDELPIKKADCDNLAKNVLDALNQIAFNDDAQVVYLTVAKLWSSDPRIVVRVWSHAKAHQDMVAA